MGGVVQLLTATGIAAWLSAREKTHDALKSECLRLEGAELPALGSAVRLQVLSAGNLPLPSFANSCL